MLREKSKQQPRCCNRTIPLDLVSGRLDAAFVQQYQRFELEIKTPNPLYCSNRDCAAFILPNNVHGDIGACSRCRQRTCRHCRQREHVGRHCAQDRDTQRVEAMGRMAGWKRCPSCGHMIEKTDGCLHMKCTQCQTDFCWNCLRRECNGGCPRY